MVVCTAGRAQAEAHVKSAAPKNPHAKHIGVTALVPLP